MPSPAVPPRVPPGLVRGLTLAAAVAVIIANVVGTGVFAKARVMTCNVGTPEMVILVWVVAGLLSLAGALTYGELAAMMPKAGGEVNYLTAAYGRRWGFLYGWMQLLVGKSASQAAVAIFFADSLNDLIGGQLGQTLLSVGPWELRAPQLIAVALIVVVTVLNFASVEAGGRMATVLTMLKVALVVGVGVLAYTFSGSGWTGGGASGAAGTCEGVSDAARLGVAGFGAAMLAALWGYDGWNNLALVGGEVKNPQRNLPRGLFIATFSVMVMYVFINIAYFYVLSPLDIASLPETSRVGTEVVRRIVGAGGASLMAFALMVSSFATLHSSILSGSRVPYALAADGLLPKKLAELSPRARIPIWSVVVSGAWASVLALSGSYDALSDLVVFGAWLFYALAVVAVFVLRKKWPDVHRPYKAWGYPVVPVLFLGVATFLILNTLYTSPAQSFIGLALIAAGLPVFAYYARRTPAVDVQPGES